MVKSNGERLREIAAVLASYGFGHLYRTKIGTNNQEQDAVNFRKAFEELGSSFIKIGQIISTRQDLLPQEYIQELAKLQDNAPAFPFSEIKRIFKEDLKVDIEEAFAVVHEEPLASASVSQVHRATMKDGTEVIVKVQRPDIEENLLRDIRLFSKIISMAPGTITDLVVDAADVLAEIEAITRRELDFRNEATALLKFKSFNKEIGAVAVPEVYTAFVSKRVLVEEYVEGIKILNVPALKEAGYLPEDIAEKLILSFLSQVFKDGYFHGDPHPGNMFIRDKKIVFIDFGIMGELAEENKENLIKLLRAVVFKDISAVMNVLLQMGLTKERINRFVFYEDLSYFFDTYLAASFSQIDIGVLFSDILDVTRKHKIAMPSDFTMLVKSLTILEGVVRDLHPGLNVFKLANAYIRSNDEISFFESVSKEKLLLSGYQLAKDTVGIPTQIRQLLDTLNSGRGKIHIDLVDIENKWTGVNKMVNRLVFALIIASLILSSAIIVALSSSTGISTIGVIIFLGAGFMGLWLLISIIRSGTL